MNAAGMRCTDPGLGAGRPLRALLIEDSSDDITLILHALKRGGYVVSADVVQTREEFLRQVRSHAYDIVLADYSLPQWTGVEALELLRQQDFDIPLILVTGALGDEKAVECMKQGATDYVLKDHLARLPASVRRALDEQHLRQLRLQAEKDLAEKMRELARSNAELEQFAYVASHDLQEPLRMVANYTQLLAERYRGKLDEQADKYIDYAVDGAMRMQEMIQDLLSFSRAGRTENGFHELDLNLAVELALENLQPAIKASGAVVKCDELPIVKAHRTQIVQLFQNLIGNAIKFRRESAPAIRIRAEEKDGQWTVSVADNGIGIAQEHFEVIFAIFQRLHTCSEYTGNGIGLAICRKIVERHGGRIWVESKEGAGATFKFTLPLTAEASEESGKAASARA